MELIELTNPQGVIVRVSPEKADKLTRSGYVRNDKPAPAPKRRGRPNKTES